MNSKKTDAEIEDLVYGHIKELEMNELRDPLNDNTSYLKELIEYYMEQKGEAAEVLKNQRAHHLLKRAAEEATKLSRKGGKSVRRKSRRRRNRKSTRRRRRKY